MQCPMQSGWHVANERMLIITIRDLAAKTVLRQGTRTLHRGEMLGRKQPFSDTKRSDRG